MSFLILLVVVALLIVALGMALFFVMKVLAMLALGAAVGLGIVVFSVAENYVSQELAAAAAIGSVIVAIAVICAIARDEGGSNRRSGSEQSPWQPDSGQEAMYEVLRRESRKSSKVGAQPKGPSIWERIFGSTSAPEQDGAQSYLQKEREILKRTGKK